MKDRLQMLIRTRIIVETKTHHVGYALHKGILLMVGEDFIEMDCGNRSVIIPIDQIRTIRMKETVNR